MDNRIRELRAKYRIYQDTLARMVGTTQQTISKIENGKMVAATDLVVNIAKVLNVSVDYLLCLTNDYKSLEYNSHLMDIATENNDLLNLLAIMSKKDREIIYLLAYSLIEKRSDPNSHLFEEREEQLIFIGGE